MLDHYIVNWSPNVQVVVGGKSASEGNNKLWVVVLSNTSRAITVVFGLDDERRVTEVQRGNVD